MPEALLYPGVYVEEVSSGVRAISGVPTSIALFIGWAPKGPVDRAVRLTSNADYERTYGGLDARSLLSYAVRQFYDNGGSDAFVVRLVDTKGVKNPSAIPAAAVAQAAIVQLSSTLDLVVKASSPGSWGNELSVKVTPVPAGGTTLVLEVFDASGNLLESFVDLSLDRDSPRYLPSVVNGSSAHIDNLALTTTSGGPATMTPATLSGGEDGVIPNPAGTAVTDFHGDLLALFAAGGIADRLDLFNIICVPGLAETMTIAKMQGFARARRAFLIVDSKEKDTVSGLNALPADLTGDDALNCALYFPWVLAPDPLKPGTVRACPPCGSIAGLYARTDASRGVWKAPAGTAAGLNGILGLKIK
jgi:phage tail sheath protein FI